MKIVFILLFLFLENNCKSQDTILLKKYLQEIDSISKTIGIKLCGFSKTIIDNRESMIVFFRVNGEMEQKLIYTRNLN